MPREALTVGLRTLLAARELLLIVTGAEKAEALHAALEGPMGPDSPGLAAARPSVPDRPVRPRGRRAPAPDRAAATATTSPSSSATASPASAPSTASPRTRARAWPARSRLCRQTPVRAVLLTGYTHTDGLSEAEQMAREWPLADVPVLLEVAGRNTAENASRSLPIVLALGVAARVSVVTSAVAPARAVLLRALPRASGWTLRLCPARPLRGSAHLLAEELGGLAGMARQRRAAMDAVRLPEGP